MRKCPVCFIGSIVRKDIKTCGGADCVALWRTMTSQQKADAIDRAAELEIESTRPHNWQPMIGHTPSSTSTKSDDTTERDRRALEKIFGDDPTKKEDKD